MNEVRTLHISRILGIAWALGAAGCFAPNQDVRKATALEQQVVSTAMREAVDRVKLERERLGDMVRVGVRASSDVDREWVLTCLENRLHGMGVRIQRGGRSSAVGIEPAVQLVEVDVAFAGSDLESSLVGVPLFVPGVPASFGSLSFWESYTQHGRARVGLQVWSPNGELEHITPFAEKSVYFSSYTFLTFIGPFIFTDMEDFRAPGDEDDEEPDEDVNPPEGEERGTEAVPDTMPPPPGPDAPDAGGLDLTSGSEE